MYLYAVWGFPLGGILEMIDVGLVGEWERKLNQHAFSPVVTTPEFDSVVLQISPQISLENNIIFHETLVKTRT
ncbi:MAG: hypothetical protein GWP10_10415 [Nitrospiraceae bacterium]|nr:hypothetical protein [Nitrospiraceae bacterium]